MKKITSNLVKFICVAIILVCTSCSGKKLSDKKAEKIITRYFEYPNVEFVGVKITRGQLDEKYGSLMYEGLVENRGFATGNAHRPIETVLFFTEKGEKYIVDNPNKNNSKMAASNIRHFNKIEGILEYPTLKTAEVTFSIKRKKVTPFGALENYNNGDIVKYKLTMKKYNDGWRINSDLERGVNVRPRDIKCF